LILGKIMEYRKVETQNETQMKGGKTDKEILVQILIVSVLALVIAFNGGRIYSSSGGISDGSITGLATGIATVSASEIIPTGVPDVYGEEIGVSYSDVSPNNPQLADSTIAKLSEYEDMQLNEQQMQRYINIAGEISCEYCCGAKSIIFTEEDAKDMEVKIQAAIDDGQIKAEDAGKYMKKAGGSACGCAHSFAMRGLAKYLVTEHPEMSDEEILSEIGKWKVLFFPGIHEQKADVLKAQGIDPMDYVNLASNKYRGIEKGQASGTGGGMVGGC
jgi:cytochrome c-type biogenesis protein CcmH/NrfF